ncbi:MAG: type II CAAX endopeptidase family protein [Candidatus Acidiferrales bacterium]|jgi:membrane protease YdiL (CAAX protease family)
MHWDSALILLFLGVAVPLLGRRRLRKLLQAPQTTKTERLVLYASTIAFQWLAVAVILWRTHAHAIAPGRLGLAIPHVASTLIASVVLAALILANQLVSLRRLSTHPAEIRGVLPQLALKVFPQDSAERLAFSALAATVAICEEIIYRGFAQRVFQDWSGGLVAAAIFGSAAMFALAHLYQGPRGVLATFVVGLIFSAARAHTGSLIPAMIAHFIADLTAGFLTPPRLRATQAATSGDPVPSVSQAESKGSSTILYR